MSYVELSIEERATIQVSRAQGMSLRHMARMLERAPSTISREVRRNLNDQIELVCKDELIHAAAEALKEAHPYEEPAFDVWRIEKF